MKHVVRNLPERFYDWLVSRLMPPSASPQA